MPSPKRRNISRPPPEMVDEARKTTNSTTDCGLGQQPGKLPVKYVKFKMSGFPGVKEGLFIPDTVDFDAKFVKTMMTNLQFKRPPLAVRIASPGIHPHHLLKDEEFKVDDFQRLRDEAARDPRSQTGEAADSASHQDSAERLKEEAAKLRTMEFLRLTLSSKLESVVSGIVSALELTESWVIKQCSTSDSFEILAHNASGRDTGLERGAGAMHVNDPCIASGGRSQGMLQQLWQAADTFDETCKASYRQDRVVCLDANWLCDPSSGRLMHTPFPDHSNFDGTKNKLKDPDDRKAISQWVNPMLPLHLFFYKRLDDEGRLDFQVNDVAMWVNPIKDMTTFGPLAFVLVSGRTEYMKQMFMKVILDGSPLVLINKTGGYGNLFPDLITALQRLLRGDESLLKELSNNNRGEQPMSLGHSLLHSHNGHSLWLDQVSSSKLLKHSLDKSGCPPEDIQHFTLADAQKLLDFAKMRPEVILDHVRVIDPLIHTPEDALTQVANVVSQIGVTMELGATETYKQALRQAWAAHKVLTSKAKSLKNNSVLLVYIHTLLDWVTVVLGTLVIYYGWQEGEGPSSWLWVALIVGPLLSGLLHTIQSRFHFAEKWGTLVFASADLLREIYLFRAQTGKYSAILTGAEEEDDEEEEDMTTNTTKRMKNSRAHFVRRTTQILALTMESALEDDSLHGLVEAESEKSLAEHIQAMTKKAETRSKKSGFSTQQASPTEGSLPAVFDDGFSRLTLDKYVQVRLRSLIAKRAAQTPSLARRQSFIDVIIFIIAVLASLLVALEYHVFLPIVVSLGTLIGKLSSFHRYGPRLRSTQRAIAGLRFWLVDHETMNKVERQAPIHKAKLINACETLEMDLISIVTLSSQTAVDDNEAHEEESPPSITATPNNSAKRRKSKSRRP